MLSLRQLRYFHALAGTCHFGRAADECAVTQPALSMQIKELEEELGLVLVERSSSGVRLTGEGEEIAERVRRILLDVQALQDFAANSAGPFGHALTIGVIPTIAPYFLPTVVPEFQDRYPDLDLALTEAQTDTLLAGLAEGDLDMAVLALPAGDDRFEALPLFEDVFLLATPAGAEVTAKPNTQDLRPESLILLEEGHCLRDQALAACGAVSPGTMSKFGATSLTTILQMVAGGYGNTLVPEMAAQSEASNNDRLRLIRFADPQPARTVGLLWRATAPRKEQYRQLGEVLQGIWEARGGRGA